MPPLDHNHAKALRIVLDILSDPRRMPRKYERAPLIIALREILDEADGDGERDDGGGDSSPHENRRGA